MKKIISVLMVLMICLGAFTGCGNTETGDEVQVIFAGSTSMEKLAKSVSEAYAIDNPNVIIQVQGGGSSAGVTSVNDGASDVGMLSRDLKDGEDAGLTAIKVAIDGISMAVNKENSVTNLTLDQIAKIYKGEITNWSEVGGADLEIVVIGREAGSGTRDGFESVVGIDEDAKYDSELNETGQVKSTVATTPGAIGYISTGYADDTVSILSVDGVEASEATIQAGTYPLQRPFMIVIKEDASEEITKIIDFILSEEGSEIVRGASVIPVS